VADEPTKDEMAALAGYTTAYFNVTPEMKALFNKALSEMWEPARLQSAIRNTAWYKSTPQTKREAWLLESSDPAEYVRRSREVRSRISALAAAVGIPMDTRSMSVMVAETLMGGLSDEQIRQRLGSMGGVFKRGARGDALGGEVGAAQQRIGAAIQAYGLKGRVTDNAMGAWLSGIAQGVQSEEFVMNTLKNLAKSSFPGLADRIDAGETIMDIAQPYIQSMGKLLEVNPEEIDLDDPGIRQALSHRNEDGKISPKTVWEFENDLRKDTRWLATNNAREGMMSTGLGILQKLGLKA